MMIDKDTLGMIEEDANHSINTGCDAIAVETDIVLELLRGYRLWQTYLDQHPKWHKIGEPPYWTTFPENVDDTLWNKYITDTEQGTD
jgi:hypothetical protein